MISGRSSSPFPDADTPVVVVGGTGRYGSAQIAGMRAAGTNIVANVAPGRGASTIDGIPTFDTVAEAVAARGARAAVIYTPPAGVRDAIVECAEAGIKFAVAAAEFVPIHDTMFALARRARTTCGWSAPTRWALRSRAKSCSARSRPNSPCPVRSRCSAAAGR